MISTSIARLDGPPPDPGETLIIARRFDEAAAYYAAARTQRPDDPDPPRSLGDIAAILGRVADAVPYYRAAAALSSSRRVHHELLSGALAELGDFDAARAVLRAYHRDHPLESIPARVGNGAPILKIAGGEGTYCRLDIGRGRRPRPFRRGGHFSTKGLLPKGRFPIRKWVIADNNINARADVPDSPLILNSIADPDIEPGPLDALAEYLRRHPEIPVINPPDRVRQTARDANARRLDGMPGVTFPRTIRFRRGTATPEAAARAVAGMGFDFPVIVREAGTHTGRTVALIRDDAELTAYFAGAKGETFYVIQYVEERFGDGSFYNKKRVFFIGGRLYPVVSHIDTVWNVHGFNRVAVMRVHPWMQEHERDFVEDPIRVVGAENYRRLEEIAALVGLDFFGIDFTVRRDGTLLIYELNASMRHSHDHARNFPYLKPHMIRISEAFAAMLERKLAP